MCIVAPACDDEAGIVRWIDGGSRGECEVSGDGFETISFPTEREGDCVRWLLGVKRLTSGCGIGKRFCLWVW